MTSITVRLGRVCPSLLYPKEIDVGSSGANHILVRVRRFWKDYAK
jgi:hypothetical protein